MTIRSTKLWSYHTTASGRVTVYTSPSGWRTIVKDVTGSNNTGVAANVEVNVFASVGRADLIRSSLNTLVLVHWTGWVVMNPGDTISVFSDHDSFDSWGSGTLLRLTGAEPPVVVQLPSPEPIEIPDGPTVPLPFP